jgi:hypothetical protein
MRSFRPWISAWGARGERERGVARVQVGGVGDLSAPKEQPTQARSGQESPSFANVAMPGS